MWHMVALDFRRWEAENSCRRHQYLTGSRTFILPESLNLTLTRFCARTGMARQMRSSLEDFPLRTTTNLTRAISRVSSVFPEISYQQLRRGCPTMSTLHRHSFPATPRHRSLLLPDLLQTRAGRSEGLKLTVQYMEAQAHLRRGSLHEIRLSVDFQDLNREVYDFR